MIAMFVHQDNMNVDAGAPCQVGLHPIPGAKTRADGVPVLRESYDDCSKLPENMRQLR